MLSIVNNENPLNNLYIPKDMVWDPVRSIWLVKEAYEAFYNMNYQMQQDGEVGIIIKEGYRSYAYQNKIYVQQQKELNLRRFTDHVILSRAKYVLPPGCSEHQLGTVCDLEITKNSKQYKWLEENAFYFGIIRRYPEEKEDITKHKCDYTHYRYVGIGHAKKMKKMNWCLEEYNNTIWKKKYDLST
ncbi:MAG: M15 family metallopeptidase [Cellulosilyticaceae bacterium]